MADYIRREDAIEITKRTCGNYAAAFSEIRKLPAADVAEVVRCKACAKHYVVNGRDMCARNAQGSGTHWIGLTATSPDAFCSRGGRKGVNDDA